MNSMFMKSLASTCLTNLDDQDLEEKDPNIHYEEESVEHMKSRYEAQVRRLEKETRELREKNSKLKRKLRARKEVGLHQQLAQLQELNYQLQLRL